MTSNERAGCRRLAHMRKLIRLTLPIAVLIAVLISLTAPSTVEGQGERPTNLNNQKSRPHDGLRLAPYVGLLAGGKRIVSSPGLAASASGDLLPGFGVGARLEKGLHDYFVLGGGVELSSDLVDLQNKRTIFLDFNLLPKGRYLLNARGIDWEFYFAVPLGFSFGFYPVTSDREYASGFNTGFLGGLQILFEKAGLFVDLGLRFRKARYPIDEVILGAIRVRETIGIKTRQFNLNVGAVIYF